MHRARYCPLCAGELEPRVPDGDTRERSVCSACGFVLYVNPRLAAGTVPVRDGRIALIRRGVGPRVGFWSWPCGFVEIDETLEQAAARETLEETGLRVTLGERLGVYSFPQYPVRGPEVTRGFVIAAWRTEEVTGDLVAGDDAAEARWFARDDIPWDQLAFRSSHQALSDLLFAP